MKRYAEHTRGHMEKCTNSWHAIRLGSTSGRILFHYNWWQIEHFLCIFQNFLAFQNLIRSVKLGIAESIEFRTMTTESVKQKLKLVLEDPKYATNMAKLSVRFRDQKEKPLDRAIWWVEWVLRNPNAVDFLKSPVLRLGFIVGNFYDVIFIISIIIFSILFILVKLLISYLRWLNNQSNPSGKRAKNEWILRSTCYQFF